ncbi:MAG: AAA family ATPase [Dorea sp.]|nr:AAA family ATPase [Dorea sp.]
MITITLSNQKGGVAKTTTSSALALGLSHKGFKVLAVDLDPQCNLCLGSGLDPMQMDNTLYNVFKKSADISDIILHSPLGYDFIPGGLMLAGADMDFTQTGREYMLSEALDAISDKYDYAIIDTPPTLGILTVNALTASQKIIIPMTADAYSLQGLSQLNTLVQSIRKYCNRDLSIMGLLITKYNGRQTVSKAVEEMIQNAAAQLQTKVFASKIRESVAIREASLLQNDFFAEAPKANATQDYNSFVEEVLNDGK